jgi:acetyl-CoA acetyltransferase
VSARFESRAVISGIGQSAVGRRLGRSSLDLTLDACLDAIADAGLDRRDIDGVATYPGAFLEPPGFSEVGARDVHDALRLELNWYQSGEEGPSQLGPLINACMAVANGLARHVLCFRTVRESSAQGTAGRAGVMPSGAGRVPGTSQWSIPFGAPSAANWIALSAQRHFHEFGTTPEQLGAIPVNNRANAARNPKAVYRDPLTLEDYLASRVISSPLRLYDCDVPVDGSTAVVVSHVDAVPDLPHRPVRVEAVGTAIHGRPSWDQWEDMTTMALRDAAAMMWRRSDLTISDVDVLQLYDGFSFLTLAWLEALGVCGRGEGGPYVQGGQRIALDGPLPLNTAGGQLSAGRLHAYGLLHEACVQLRGEGGERQVPGRPRVAVTAAGGGPTAGAMLLTS